MKKTLLLCFCCFAYAVPGVVRGATQAPVVVGASPKDSARLSGEEDLLRQAPVGNYPIFAFEFLKGDWAHQRGGGSLPLKKLDWVSLLRNNMSFLYAIRLGQSRFAFCPGIGNSTLEYAFARRSVGSDEVYKTLKREQPDRTECQEIDPAQLGDQAIVTGSSCAISYIDFLFRFRFNTVLEDPQQGFHVWLGGKFGLRTDATTRINYTEYANTRYANPGASLVRRGNFNLSRVMFGVQGGLGYQRFEVNGTYALLPALSLFAKQEGPTGLESVCPFSVSLAVNLL